MAERPPPPPPLTKGEVAKEYLTAYNSICALLWLSVFGRVVVILPITGVESVYEAAGDFTKWTQTVAVLEILHSAFGTLLCTLMLHRATTLFSAIYRRRRPSSRKYFHNGWTDFSIQASSAPPSLRRSCKSPRASSLSGLSSTSSLPRLPPPRSTAACSSPGPLLRSFGTATSSSTYGAPSRLS